jgi:hypothetical protein
MAKKNSGRSDGSADENIKKIRGFQAKYELYLHMEAVPI